MKRKGTIEQGRLMGGSVFWHEPLLDPRGLHLEPQPIWIEAQLRLCLSLHGKSTFQQRQPKATAQRLAHGWPVMLSPFQTEGTTTFGLPNLPLHGDPAGGERESPMHAGVPGEFVNRHTHWNREIGG